MDYKLLIRIGNIFTYIMWFGLFLSMFFEGYIFIKIGIILSSIILPKIVKEFKELESNYAKNDKK